MAHFAKLDENNIVISVHVVDNSVITVNGSESEQTGIEFLTNLHGYSNWKQTSYNGSFRKNFAAIGMSFDSIKNAFIPIKPYESWILDEESCTWNPPIAFPTDGKRYNWDEATTTWVELV